MAIGYQVHFPPHRSQQRTNALCKAKSSRLWQSRSFDRHPPQEPGHNPIPSGHILRGRRINRSVQGRPTVPKRHPRKRAPRRGGVDVGFPTVPAPQRVSPESVQASSLGRHLQKPRRPSDQTDRALEAPPNPAFAESKAGPKPQPVCSQSTSTTLPQFFPLSRCPRSACTL